jgi:hypothetical protein
MLCKITASKQRVGGVMIAGLAVLYAECNTSAYLYMHLLVISHKKSSVHGHESYKIE